MKRRVSWCLFAATLLGAGCDGIVGLAPPDSMDGTGDGGSDATADGDGSGLPFYPTGPGGPGEASLGPTSGGGPPDVSSPPGAWWPIPPGGIGGMAFAAGNLYLLMPRPGEAGATSVLMRNTAIGPDVRYAPPSGTVTALGSDTSFAFFGVYGSADVQILSVDGILDLEAKILDPLPEVDVTQALPYSALGPILAIASDGAAIYWTESVDSKATLLKHVRGDVPASATVLLTAGPGDAFRAVAVDAANVYTVGALGGTIYAVPKDAPDAGATIVAASALPGTPLGTNGGAVYFLRDAGSGSTGDLASTWVADAGSLPPPVPAQTFALDDCAIWVGSGPNLLFAPITQQPSLPAPHVIPLDSDVVGVAAQHGTGAVYTRTSFQMIQGGPGCP